jgi:hypothetical protein
MFGIIGAAWAYVITAVAMLPVNFVFITRYLEMNPWNFLAHLWRPLVAATVMYLGVRVLGPPMPEGAIPSAQAAASLITSVALGAPLYVLADLLLWQLSGRPAGAETTALGQLRSIWFRTRTKLRSLGANS